MHKVGIVLLIAQEKVVGLWMGLMELASQPLLGLRVSVKILIVFLGLLLSGMKIPFVLFLQRVKPLLVLRLVCGALN